MIGLIRMVVLDWSRGRFLGKDVLEYFVWIWKVVIARVSMNKERGAEKLGECDWPVSRIYGYFCASISDFDIPKVLF